MSVNDSGATEEKKTLPKYFSELEGLRGLMALWVVIGHWSTTVPLPFAIGSTKLYNQYAVDVFIFLSGFVIANLLENNKVPYLYYIVRRFFRIFPVYLFFLLLSILAAPLALDVWQNAPEGFMKAPRIDIAQQSLLNFWPHVTTHVLGLQTLVPPKILPQTSFAFLGQAWSISLEWQFYLVAPWMLVFLRKVTSKKAILLMIGLPILTVASHRLMPDGFLGANLHKFIVGILSYFFIKKGKEVNAKYIDAAILFIASTCLLFWTVKALPYLIWMVVLLTLAPKDGAQKNLTGLVSSVLNHPFAQTTGHMCYSIYLSHMLVIVGGLWGVETFGIVFDPVNSALFLLYIVAVTLIVSWGSYRFIEKPFHDYGRKLGSISSARKGRLGIA